MDNIQVNTANLRNVMNKLLIQVDELNNMLSSADWKIEGTKENFDTPASAYFREMSKEYILDEQKYLKDVIIPLINSLGTLADEYDLQIANSGKVLGGINI